MNMQGAYSNTAALTLVAGAVFNLQSGGSITSTTRLSVSGGELNLYVPFIGQLLMSSGATYFRAGGQLMPSAIFFSISGGTLAFVSGSAIQLGGAPLTLPATFGSIST